MHRDLFAESQKNAVSLKDTSRTKFVTSLLGFNLVRLVWTGFVIDELEQSEDRSLHFSDDDDLLVYRRWLE